LGRKDKPPLVPPYEGGQEDSSSPLEGEKPEPLQSGQAEGF